MQEQELRALLWLLQTPGVGTVRVRALVGHFRTATATVAAGLPELCRVPGIDRVLAENILQAKNSAFVDQQLESLAREQARMVTFWDGTFPALLKRIPDPPILLFGKGEWRPAQQNVLAIVGTRAPSPYGKIVAERLTADLVAQGFTIVSGLARGVDTIAHRTALQQGGRTIAILGSGLDVFYPPENQKLLGEICASGAVLTEYPFGTKPDAVNFPRRNRIISGMALGVLVVEAGLESGAMITANLALDQNREVFAVPGSISNPKSAGPHHLIQQGAKLVQNVADVLAELQGQLPLFEETEPACKAAPVLEAASQRVFEALSSDARHIDELTRQLDLPLTQLLAILLELEFKSLIKQLPGKLFVKM